MVAALVQYNRRAVRGGLARVVGNAVIDAAASPGSVLFGVGVDPPLPSLTVVGNSGILFEASGLSAVWCRWP